MVFGNKGDGSGTGVCFTRDLDRREQVYGEFLQNAQGEDVVAGDQDARAARADGRALPEAYAQLLETIARLEAHYRDMQDIEFTVESEGTFFLAQTRSAKRTAAAALRAAVEMVAGEPISKEEAVAAIDPAQLDQLLQTR